MCSSDLNVFAKYPGLIRSKNFGNFAHVADAAQAQTKAAQSLIPNLRKSMSPEERMHFDAELGKSPQDYMGAMERAQTNVARDKQHGELVKAGVPIESIDRAKLYSPVEVESLAQQVDMRKAREAEQKAIKDQIIKAVAKDQASGIAMSKALAEAKLLPQGWEGLTKLTPPPPSPPGSVDLARRASMVDRHIDNIREARNDILKRIQDGGMTKEEEDAARLELRTLATQYADANSQLQDLIEGTQPEIGRAHV